MSPFTARPARLFGTLAFAEMVTWTLLLLGMLGKYVLHLGPWGVRIGGGLHGFVFLAYVLVTVFVAVDQRWHPADTARGLASAVLPYATLPFERRALERGLLRGESWRLRDEPPAAAPERLVAAALRRPLLAAATGLLLVGLTYAGLLSVGPPTQWFA